MSTIFAVLIFVTSPFIGINVLVRVVKFIVFS